MKSQSGQPGHESEDRADGQHDHDHIPTLFGRPASFLASWEDKAVGRLESGIVAGLLGLLVLIVSPFLFSGDSAPAVSQKPPQGEKNETTAPQGEKNEAAKPPQTEVISTKAPPVISAPADPGKPLLELRSELTSLVSYEVVTDDQKLQQPLEAIVTAVPGYKPEAAEGKERVYARTTSSQGITKVVARSNGVLVTFKAEPDEALLGSLKDPAQNLATTLGFTPKNVWSGSGLTRTYE